MVFPSLNGNTRANKTVKYLQNHEEKLFLTFQSLHLVRKINSKKIFFRHKKPQYLICNAYFLKNYCRMCLLEQESRPIKNKTVKGQQMPSTQEWVRSQVASHALSHQDSQCHLLTRKQKNPISWARLLCFAFFFFFWPGAYEIPAPLCCPDQQKTHTSLQQPSVLRNSWVGRASSVNWKAGNAGSPPPDPFQLDVQYPHPAL